MKKLFYIFAIIAPLITSPALSETKTPECENAISILSKYCIDEKSPGMGGDCCNIYPNRKFRTIQFYCYKFKPGLKTQDIKNEISTLCKNAPVEYISLRTTEPGFALDGAYHELTGETTGGSESNNVDTYADAMRTPDNWKEYEVQAAQLAPKKDSAQATPKSYIGKNCEDQILSDANDAVSGTIRMSGNELYCDITCRNGFRRTNAQKIKKYNLDLNNTITLKHICEPDSAAPNPESKEKLIDINGQIIDSNNNEPLIGVNIRCVNKYCTGKGAATDINGKFELSQVPSNATFEISYIGYKTISVSAIDLNDKTIQLTEDAQLINEVTVQACNLSNLDEIIAGYVENGKCIPTECDTTRYTLQNAGTPNAKCVEQECKPDNAKTGVWTGEKKAWHCEVKECKNSEFTPNEDKTACIKKLKKCNQDDHERLTAAGASATGLSEKDNKTCIAQECKCGFNLDGEKCTPWEKDANGQYTKPCDTTELNKINAKSGVMACNAKGKAYCQPNECINENYEKNKKGTKCIKIGATSEPEPEEEEKTEAPKLSREDSQAKINELQANADAMKAKEQSTENKLLGGATMAATGLGGMQAMSALAEQSADQDAETAMRAYLATFSCEYGNNRVSGGEQNVQMPGGNELINLYREYVNLANNLKVRKAALDMRPGIESEPILDSATSGLYDDVSIGKTSGAFTSLARALQNPDGPDAAAWASQKAETAEQLKSGLTTAGIGAAAGIIGNQIINKNSPKERSDEINRKYESLKKLKIEILQIPPQTAPCPSDATGENSPNCECQKKDNKIYNPKTNTCELCPGNQTVQNGECKCPADINLWDAEKQTCIAMPQQCTPECTPKEGDHLELLQNCKCSCMHGYRYTDGYCVCESPNIVENGECIKINEKTTIIQVTTVTDTTTLPAGSLFELNSYKLLEPAKEALKNFVKDLEKESLTDCELEIIGYTDPIGKAEYNKTLSKNRAKSVEEFIKKQTSTKIKKISHEGKGEDDCTCGTGEANNINYDEDEYEICKGRADDYTLSGSDRFAPCRRVEIKAQCKETKSSTTVIE